MPSIVRRVTKKLSFSSAAHSDDAHLRKLTRPIFVRRIRWWAVLAVVSILSLTSASSLDRTFSSVPGGYVGTQDLQGPEIEPSLPLKGKQKQDLLKSNFEKMKHDADDLAALAKSLQEDLNKSNENVLSLKVVEKAERIEKLARKIKSTAKGD